jgi:RNA polymerase sigma-70 factor (ECF subfamily)
MDVLLERLRRRDPAAFQEALARYGPPLQRTIARFLRDRVEAEDVAQEAFARLFQRVDCVRDLRPWLYQVAMNLARAAIAKRRAPPLPSAAPASDPALRDLIDAALAALPEKTRAAFVLREIGGLTTDEIAGTEGCSADAVRQRICDARRRLRDALKREEVKP